MTTRVTFDRFPVGGRGARGARGSKLQGTPDSSHGLLASIMPQDESITAMFVVMFEKSIESIESNDRIQCSIISAISQHFRCGTRERRENPGTYSMPCGTVCHW